MKRFLSLILVLALCLTCILPVTAAQETEEPGEASIRPGAKSMLTGDVPIVPAKREDRSPSIDSSPLMIDLTIKTGVTSLLAFTVRNPGGYAGVGYGVEVFRGTSQTDANFVGGYYDEVGLGSAYEEMIAIDTNELGMGIGTYTVAYFIITGSGDNAHIKEDTLKTFPLTVVNYDIPLEGLAFYGLDKDLNLRIGDAPTTITPKLIPSNTTVERSELLYAVSDTTIFTAYSQVGQFSLRSKGIGDAIFAILLADITFELNVHVLESNTQDMLLNQTWINLHPDTSTLTPLEASFRLEDNEREVRFYSEDPSIATVEQDGRTATITAHAVGKTRIVAESGGFTEYCEVEVWPHSGEVVERVEATATQPGYEVVINCDFPSCTAEQYTNVIPPVFEDTISTAWYCEGVDYVYANELFNGVTPTQFAPNKPMTRAMLVTVLWRVAGQPQAGAPGFADVKDGLWYSQPIAWAAENGIVTGVKADQFAPEKNITREQLATILYRYAGYVSDETDSRTALDNFPDAGKVSPWASDAMQWCVARELIGGSNGKLLPQGNATRAQVATIITRYLNASAPEAT